MDPKLREKLLEKLMDFLSMLEDPPSGDGGDKASGESQATGDDPKAKIEMLAVDAKPKLEGEGSDEDKLKGII